MKRRTAFTNRLRIGLQLSLLSLAASFCMNLAIGDDPRKDSKVLIEGGSLDAELLETGLPRGWSTVPLNFENVDCFTVLDVFRSPPRSARLSSRLPYAHVVSGQFPRTENEVYTARAWVKAPADFNGEVYLIFNFMDAKGRSVGQNLGGGFANDGIIRGDALRKAPEWKLIAIETRSDKFPEATHAEVFAVQKGGGTTYWDDFDVRSSPVPPTTNLLPNGDLERVVVSDFARWTSTISDGGSIEINPETQDPARGFVAAHFTGDADSFRFQSSPVPVTREKTYRLTARHRTPRGIGHLILIVWKNEKKQSEVVTQQSPSQPWADMNEIVAKPDDLRDATHLTVEYLAKGKFDLYLDACTLTVE